MHDFKKQVKAIKHKLRHNTIFILLILVVWFIYRTGTRPTRVLYPCQMAILNNLQLQFTTFFASISAAFTLPVRLYTKKLFTTKNLVVIAVIGIALTSVYVNDYLNKPSSSSYVTSDFSNYISYDVKINYPHRVVSVQDDDVTTWDFSCSGGSCPYYGSDTYIDQIVVDNMVDRGLMQLTGTSDILSAWQEIIPDYFPGKKIAVKVNFNAANGWVDTDTQIDAIPQPMNALIKGLKVLGFQEQDIWIYDASRLIPDRYRNEIKAHYPNVQFFANQGNGADVQAVTKTSSDPDANVDLSQFPGTWATKLPDQVVNTDYLIDMPIIKAHGIAGITLSFKNHYGTAYNMEAHTYIDPDTDDPSKNPLITVWENPHIGGKTVLILGDAIYGGFGYSADIARWNSFDNGAPKMLFFGVDPVATDSVMYDYLLREQSAGGVTIKSGSGDLLQLAENHGIGIYEHWNNDVDRDYPNIDYVELDLDTLQTCAEQDGYACTSDQTCPGTWLDSSDEAYCCDQECEDPVDIDPPIRSNGQPDTSLPPGTIETIISLETDENSTCRYETTTGIDYDSMANIFSVTGEVAHEQFIEGLADGNTYEYYIKCNDTAGNNNTDDYVISFDVNALVACQDINNDNIINIIDLTLIIFWQGKSSADATWEHYDHLDTNQDGVINYDDVTDVINNFGQTC